MFPKAVLYDLKAFPIRICVLKCVFECSFLFGGNLRQFRKAIVVNLSVSNKLFHYNNVLSKAFWNALQALANLKWYSLGDSISTHEHVERWFDLRKTQLVFSGRHFEHLETMKNTKKHKFEHVNLHVQKIKKLDFAFWLFTPSFNWLGIYRKLFLVFS